MLSAYYFRAQMYTIVPRQVRDDMRWMRDHGSDAVVVGVLEQDLFAARENLDIISREAEAAGLQLLVTPSRWGSLVAGCPKVPSILCATRHDCWARCSDGGPVMGFLGPIASVHHEATIACFHDLLRDLLQSWPVAGIVWDELKALDQVDYSDAARQALGEAWSDDLTQHNQAQVDFFGAMNRYAKRLRPELRTSLFIYGHCQGTLLDQLARMPSLDDFGCDGRPWAQADGGTSDSNNRHPPTKFLIDAGPRFIDAARAAGRAPLALIENHAVPTSAHALMERRLPEILQQGWEHLLYYYYPRSCEDPDGAMSTLGRHLRHWR